MKLLINSLMVFLLAMMSYNVMAEGDEATEPEEFLTGKELLDNCNEGASPGSPSQFCMHYVFGYVQNIEMLQAAEPDQPRLFCINPQAVGLPEVTEKMKNWLSDQGGRLDQEAYLLVGEALAKNYPCEASPF